MAYTDKLMAEQTFKEWIAKAFMMLYTYCRDTIKTQKTTVYREYQNNKKTKTQ